MKAMFDEELDQFMASARDVAQHVWDDDGMRSDYHGHVQAGMQPSDHVLWHAAFILGLLDHLPEDD